MNLRAALRARTRTQLLDALVRDTSEAPQTEPRDVTKAHYVRVLPQRFQKGTLLIHSPELCEDVFGAQVTGTSADTVAEIEALLADPVAFGGSAVTPWATTYAGGVMGHYVGQLGDGRAMSLCQVQGEKPVGLCEVQLKGCGQTPFNRSFDGRCVLRSCVREFLASEHMHALGVPTTRALGVLLTGEDAVPRAWFDKAADDAHSMIAETGALTCRVAPSFLRFGHLAYFEHLGEHGLLKTMADCAIDSIPLLTAGAAADTASPVEKYVHMVEVVAETYASLIAEWMRVGYVHGNMNSDNMALCGVTLDYGPFGMLDAYNPDWCPWLGQKNHHYSYGRQSAAAHVNLGVLAHAVEPLVKREAVSAEERDAMLGRLRAALKAFPDRFQQRYDAVKLAKLGVGADKDTAAKAAGVKLYSELARLMTRDAADFTVLFRLLSAAAAKGDLPASPDFGCIAGAFRRRPAETDLWAIWLTEWAALRPDGEAMKKTNPAIVLRNHMALQAYEAADEGDPSVLHEMYKALKTPYDDAHMTGQWFAPPPVWATRKLGVHIMTCSS